MEDKLEKAFGDFIDRREYDEASNAMLALTRSAFIEILLSKLYSKFHISDY